MSVAIIAVGIRLIGDVTFTRVGFFTFLSSSLHSRPFAKFNIFVSGSVTIALLSISLTLTAPISSFATLGSFLANLISMLSQAISSSP